MPTTSFQLFIPMKCNIAVQVVSNKSSETKNDEIFELNKGGSLET